MLKIFYGDDRSAIAKAVQLILGEDYELFEADNLTRADMDTLFFGVSIFAESRKILVKDLDANAECWEVLPQYAETPHNVVIWNASLDKRSSVYKALDKIKGVAFKECKMPVKVDPYLSFKVLDSALEGHTKAALHGCDELEMNSDPFMTLGGMATSLMKKIDMNRKAPAALKILAKTDMDLKTTGLEPWELIKIAMVKISEL